MINLKKLFRRKKGQGALEYLFMIAAALIIIFVVVRYISGTGQQATSQGDLLVLQTQAELVKSSFQAKGWWDSAVVTVSNNSLTLTVDSITRTYTIPSEYNELSSKTDYSRKSIKDVYNECQAGDLGACQVFGLLSGKEQGS